MMHWWYGNGMGFGGYLLMALSTLAIWALIAVVIIALVRGLARSRHAADRPASGPVTPEAILAERFARGEISEREYSERLAVLHDGPRSTTGG